MLRQRGRYVGGCLRFTKGVKGPGALHHGTMLPTVRRQCEYTERGASGRLLSHPCASRTGCFRGDAPVAVTVHLGREGPSSHFHRGRKRWFLKPERGDPTPGFCLHQPLLSPTSNPQKGCGAPPPPVDRSSFVQLSSAGSSWEKTICEVPVFFFLNCCNDETMVFEGRGFSETVFGRCLKGSLQLSPPGGG